MRKATIPAAGVALLLMGGIAVGGAATASAAPLSSLTEVCATAEGTAGFEETSWLTAPPAGSGWEVVETRVVIDREAVPGSYEETSWFTGLPTDGRTWTQVAERHVVDVEAQPAQGEPTIWVENPDYVPESTIEVFDHWQRYSWTGGPLGRDEEPAFPGPDWQANTESDPHGVGAEGAYYRSHGSSGKGDWFYLQAVSRTETVPAQGEPDVEVENPDYRPAVEEQGHDEFCYGCTTEGVEEVSHLEYRYARTVVPDPVPVEPDPVVPVPVEPVVPVKPVPVEPVDEPEEVVEEPAAPETLPETGAADQAATLLGAGLLSALGAGMVTVRRVFGRR